MTDCIVVDMKTRRRETVQPSRVDPAADHAAGTRIMGMMASLLEQELPTLSAESDDRLHFERALRAARRRAPREDR